MSEQAKKTVTSIFEGMLEDGHSSLFLEICALDIRAHVARGETSWDELGFSDSDVAKRLPRKAA